MGRDRFLEGIIAPMPDRSRARQLAAEYIGKGDPTGWFEALYREAEHGESEVPWDDGRPNAHLLAFWDARAMEAKGKSAMVVACGLGDDAEQVAAWGFRTTAFDISPSAIKAARSRFPNTNVNYVAADLLNAPADWDGGFDFVFETNTLQALPAELRPAAMRAIARFLKPGGLLLAIARAREESDPLGEVPWPLTRREFEEFERAGLEQKSFTDVTDSEPPHTRRFVITYTR
jgi:SAM-dependent methyltransferase